MLIGICQHRHWFSYSNFCIWKTYNNMETETAGFLFLIETNALNQVGLRWYIKVWVNYMICTLLFVINVIKSICLLYSLSTCLNFKDIFVVVYFYIPVISYVKIKLFKTIFVLRIYTDLNVWQESSCWIRYRSIFLTKKKQTKF